MTSCSMNNKNHNENSGAHGAHGAHDAHDHEAAVAAKVTFGFWVYVMTDAIMFAAMLATYAVLKNGTYGGPGIQQVAHLPHILIQTLILTLSAFTFGLGFIAFLKSKACQLRFWLVITFILGVVFLSIEIGDLTSLVKQGYSWQTSAFLSSYFTVLGLHALHIMVALLWMLVLLVQFSCKGFSTVMKTRFTCLGLFWNFLNLMWLIIFTVVFLIGAV